MTGNLIFKLFRNYNVVVGGIICQSIGFQALAVEM